MGEAKKRRTTVIPFKIYARGILKHFMKKRAFIEVDSYGITQNSKSKIKKVSWSDISNLYELEVRYYGTMTMYRRYIYVVVENEKDFKKLKPDKKIVIGSSYHLNNILYPEKQGNGFVAICFCIDKLEKINYQGLRLPPNAIFELLSDNLKISTKGFVDIKRF